MNTNIQKLLLQVKTLCVQRHVRLTPQRLAVLQLISQCKKSISAYDLLHLLRQSSLPKAKPSTIYRALNFLLEQRFIHRIESTNRFMLCHHFLDTLSHSHNFVFFICNHCKQVTEQTTQDIEKILKNMAKITGFTISNNIIEAHGLCIKCTKISNYDMPYNYNT